MADIKLVGRDDAAGSVVNTANNIIMDKWTAVSSGYLTSFKVSTGGNTNVKISIYADSAGEPGGLLFIEVSKACVAGVNIIPLPPVYIIAGVTYWIAFNSDANMVGAQSGGGLRRIKALTYSSSFPNPAGSGYTADTVYQDLTSGWGAASPNNKFFQMF